VGPEIWFGTDGVNSGQNVITTLAALDLGQLAVRRTKRGTGTWRHSRGTGTLESRDHRFSIWLSAFRIPIYGRCVM